MAAPLSRDLRRQLVWAVEADASAREVVRRFEVSPSAAVKIVQRARETDSAVPARIEATAGRCWPGTRRSCGS